MARGIVIQISGDGESARKALEMVQQNLRDTGAEAERTGESMRRMGSHMEGGVPQMAAASAGLRALEGNFTNNIRAGERFISMLPGMSELLQTAFPVVGATVLGVALAKMAENAYHAYQNIVLLKGAREQLAQLDITVDKRIASAADSSDESLESSLRATQGQAAALQQKLKYQSGKGVDLSDLFYDDKFKGQKDNIKADYENLYKSVAPADLPERLKKIKEEVANLNGALAAVRNGAVGSTPATAAGFGAISFGGDGRKTLEIPKVGNYGPGPLEDPENYYKARLKAAGDVQRLLEAETTKRARGLQATGDEILEAQKKQDAKGAEGQSPLLRSRERLEEEQAKARLAKQKMYGELYIAQLTAEHKMAEVDDETFYNEKIKKLNEGFDEEEASLRSRQTALNSLYEKQGKLKGPKDAEGHKAEQNETLAKLSDVQSQMDAVTAKRGQAGSEIDAERVASQRAAELAGLRIAAELEAQRNVSIAARLELNQKETNDKVRDSRAHYGTDQDEANIRAAGEMAAKRLEIGQVTRQITEIEAEYRRQIEQVNASAERGDITQRAAKKQIVELQKEEAAALEKQVAVYDALAKSAGGDFVEKAKALHAEIMKLQTPDNRDSAEFAKTLTSGMTSMADQMAEDAARGKNAFKDMVQSMETDAIKLAGRLAMLRIEQMLSGKMGAGAGAASAGGGMSGMTETLAGLGASLGMPQMPNVSGPSMFRPATPAAAGGGASSLISSLAQTGAKAAMPSITHNVINQSSAPIASSSGDIRYDEMLHQFVIDTFLNDHATGGPMSQLTGSNGA